jgi:antitoxin component YwqK of YwqJK toxin-antitoxin module
MRIILVLATCLLFTGCRLRTRELPPPYNGVHHVRKAGIGGTGYSYDAYYENGVVRRTVYFFANGTKSSEWTAYNSTERLDTSLIFYSTGAMRFIVVSKAGAPVEWKEYYDNGMVKTVGDSIGEREGYYPNGKIKHRLVWRNKEVREKREWYSNGTKKEISEWKGDRFHGMVRRWDSAGTMIEIERYHDGKKYVK